MRSRSLQGPRESYCEPDISRRPRRTTRGIRLGGFPQIRKEISNAMEGIFFGKMTVQAGLDQAVERGNAIIRRFEKTYAGQTLN